MKLRSFISANFLTIAIALTGTVPVGCNSGSSNSDSTVAGSKETVGNTLLGAGSTFVYPLFSKQFSEYNKLTGL
jgi:phosphate transport system substrate-binding protein